MDADIRRDRRIVVHASDVHPHEANVHLLVCALGYETRSSFIPRKFHARASRRVAIAFADRKVISYSDNQLFLTQAGFQIFQYERNSFLRRFYAELDEIELMHDEPVTRVLVDVSSMSRPMMAQIVVALSRIRGRRPLQVRFVYCPAVFVQPDPAKAPVAVSEPVIPEFAGWSDTPDRPAAAVFGLGYEYHQALGTLDYLEPASAWAFIPTGEDNRYDRAVSSANKEMYDLLGAEKIHPYRVDRPHEYYRIIETLVYGLIQDTRPILIPFGPKVFALVCMLVAQVHTPAVTVWRVSGEQVAEPSDRVASGKIIGLSVTFQSVSLAQGS